MTSYRSSLPEIAGNAALYFGPESVEEMCLAMERLLTDAALRQQLVVRGRERVKQFGVLEGLLDVGGGLTAYPKRFNPPKSG
jgi:hypothetical protein